MRNWSWIAALLILLGLTICIPVPVVSVEPVPPVVPPSGTFEKYGPRVDYLIFKVAGDPLTQANFLELGEIDVMDHPVPVEQIDDWLADEDITMGEYSEWGWCELDINNQMWPLGHGSMRPEQGALGGPYPPPEADWYPHFPPTWDEGHYWINYSCQRCLDARDFRRALAHLVDRSAGACVPWKIGVNMETFIFPAISPWENPDAPKYEYNSTRAEEILNNAGFNDYDGDGELEYSRSHATPTPPTPPPDMEELPDLQFWIRVDDPDRMHAGQWLRDEMIKLGIPLDAYITSRTLCYYHVWELYDYSLYTGEWDWGRQPDMYYELWHSTKDTYPMPCADNYNRYHSQEYDEWAWKLKTAENLTAAKEAVDQCQLILHDDTACIPLYTYGGYVAHRTYYPSTTEVPNLPVEEQKYSGQNWTGFVNEKGYSFYGDWSPLNVHPHGFDKGGILRHGLLYDVGKFDPVDATLFHDWLVLSKVYEPLIVYHPYNVTKYIPWLCKNYTVGEWAGPNGPATKVTFEIIPNILWQDNVPFTPYDPAFSYQYYKDAMSLPHWWALTNFDHADYNDTHVTLYFNIKSWRALDWCTLPIIPSHIWEPIPPTVPGDPTVPGSWAYDPEAEDTVIGTGPFRFAKDGVVGRVDRVPGTYIRLEANPTYFRKLVWPDVCDATHTPCTTDGWVDAHDIVEVLKPGNIFACENDDGTWPAPPGDWGEHVDVNKDGVISMADVMEVALHFAEPWPPPWYVDS